MINPPSGMTAQDLWEAITDGNQTHVKMDFYGQGIVLTDEDIDISRGVTVEDIFNSEDDLTPGGAVSKQVQMQVLSSAKTSGLDWTAEFELSFGVEVEGVTKWTRIGYFYGEKPSNAYSARVVDFIAYDRMQKFNALANGFTASVPYPITLYDYYTRLCNYVGITGTHQTGLLPSAFGRVYTEPPFEGDGYTCRDILSWIAESCGVYARVNSDGDCTLTWYEDSTAYTLEQEFEFSVEHADEGDGLIWDEFDDYYWYEADKLTWAFVCSYSETYNIEEIHVTQYGNDATVSYPANYGSNVYTIVENPFLQISSYDDIEDWVAPIYDRMIDFGGHLPAKIECIGNWLIEAGDVITAEISETRSIPMAIFARTLHWNGSITATYETTGNISRPSVSPSAKGKLITRNTIRFAAKDEYYGRQSGIEITPEGIRIEGSRSIDMVSGGKIALDGGSEIEVNSGSDIRVKADADLIVESGGDLTVQSGGNLSVESGGGIDINASGNLKLNGATVEIKSGSTFDVESTNFYINSAEKYVQTGDWVLDPWGLQAKTYNSSLPVNYLLVYGRPGYYSSENIPIVQTSQQIYGIRNSKYEACFSFSLTQGNTYDRASLELYLMPGHSTPELELTPYFYINGSVVSGIGVLGNATNKWDVYGRTIRYVSLVQDSSKYVKHDIKPLPSAGEKIDKLKPVSFVYDNDANEQKRNGLIYEDTIGIMPEICTQNEAEKGIDYTALIPVLLKEIQELRARVKDLEERLGE